MEAFVNSPARAQSLPAPCPSGALGHSGSLSKLCAPRRLKAVTPFQHTAERWVTEDFQARIPLKCSHCHARTDTPPAVCSERSATQRSLPFQYSLSSKWEQSDTMALKVRCLEAVIATCSEDTFEDTRRDSFPEVPRAAADRAHKLVLERTRSYWRACFGVRPALGWGGRASEAGGRWLYLVFPPPGCVNALPRMYINQTGSQPKPVP